MRGDYDLVILGGGSAGIVAGVMAGGLGLRTLLIEKEKMGGECLNTGCVPSKALIHAARTLRSSDSIGFRSSPVTREDSAAALGYARNSVSRVRDADATEDLLRRYGTEIKIGKPSFVDRHTVLLDGKTIQADHFILATGSSPHIPSIPGLSPDRFKTNRDLFDLAEIPRRLLVIGAGPVGVEMAQAFQRLGSQVTMVQKGPRILPRDDPELTTLLLGFLREEGLDVRLETDVHEVINEKGEIYAILKSTGPSERIPFDLALVAVGRLPNVDGLNLQAAGVRVEKNGIPVDSSLRTSATNIYACGDVIGKYQFSHVAEYEAKLAVRNIMFAGRAKAVFRVSPWCTFTDPELAHVGLTEDEARERGIRCDVLRQNFAQDDRALTDNEGRGIVKVLTQGLSGKILGAHILGPRAGELLQEWTLAMEHGLGIRAIAGLIHVYPTLSMANQHAAQRWYELKARDPLVAKGLRTYVQEVRPRRAAIAAGLAGAALLGAAFMAERWLRNRER